MEAHVFCSSVIRSYIRENASTPVKHSRRWMSHVASKSLSFTCGRNSNVTLEILEVSFGFLSVTGSADQSVCAYIHLLCGAYTLY